MSVRANIVLILVFLNFLFYVFPILLCILSIRLVNCVKHVSYVTMYSRTSQVLYGEHNFKIYTTALPFLWLSLCFYFLVCDDGAMNLHSSFASNNYCY